MSKMNELHVDCKYRVSNHKVLAPRHDSVKEPLLCTEGEVEDGRAHIVHALYSEASQQWTGDGWLGGRERHA